MNQVGVMKIKVAFKSILAGVISAVLSYRALNLPAILCALALRRKMPDAWFSGLIVWYATFAVIGISIVIAGFVFRMVYNRAGG